MSDIAAAETIAMITAMERWIWPVKHRFDNGETVQVSLSPGDDTHYGMIFVPPDRPWVCSHFDSIDGHGVLADGNGLLAVENLRIVTEFAVDGDPFPHYVADAIRNTNPYTVTAVGTTWALMVGVPAVTVAQRFNLVVAGTRATYDQWVPSRFGAV